MAKRIIDLTMPLNNAVSGVSIEAAKILARDGWNASTFHLYSHSATHMDAPMHFEVNDQTIDEIPVERFISQAWVIDLSGLAPSTLLQIADMAAIEDKITKGESILLRTDWSKRIGTDAYRNAFPQTQSRIGTVDGREGRKHAGRRTTFSSRCQ